jgi:hypothetical protein
MVTQNFQSNWTFSYDSGDQRPSSRPNAACRLPIKELVATHKGTPRVYFYLGEEFCT